MGIALPLSTMGRDLLRSLGRAPVSGERKVEEAAVRSLGRDGLTLSAAAREALRPAVLLDEAQLAKLDARLNAINDLSAEGKALRTEFHRPIYADDDLQERAFKALNGWVLGGKGKKALLEAAGNLEAGKAPATDLEKTVHELTATRRARWQRLSEREGVPMPDRFKLYRGVRGDYALDEVLRGWMLDPAHDIPISHHEVMSWSTNRQTAEAFMSGSPASVLYQAEVPFEQTLADKFVDGGSFVALCPDQNEVVVKAAKDSLRVPKDQIQVVYKDRTYTYADRHELFEAWHADHMPAAA